MNMQPIMDYTTFLLNAIATFLGSEPVIYLFGTVIFCFVIKAFKILAS